MQFIVPQFIEIETKIIGPISVRQFVILLVAGGIIFILYELLASVAFIISAVLVGAVAGTFAFARINSQPFHTFALNFIQTMKTPNLRVWNKGLIQYKVRTKKDSATPKASQQSKKDITSSRLNELSLQVDTGGSYKTENNKYGPKK